MARSTFGQAVDEEPMNDLSPIPIQEDSFPCCSYNSFTSSSDEDKPVEDESVEDKPDEDKPVEDKPVEDKPVEDKSTAEDKPVHDAPSTNEPEPKPQQKPNYILCGRVYKDASTTTRPLHFLCLDQSPAPTLQEGVAEAMATDLGPTTTTPCPDLDPTTTTPSANTPSPDPPLDISSFYRLPEGYSFCAASVEPSTRVLQVHLGPNHTVVREVYPARRSISFWLLLGVAWMVSLFCAIVSTMDRCRIGDWDEVHEL